MTCARSCSVGAAGNSPGPATFADRPPQAPSAFKEPLRQLPRVHSVLIRSTHEERGDGCWVRARSRRGNGSRGSQLLNPYDDGVEDLVTGNFPWSLRSRRARTWLVGGMSAGFTAAGVLLGTAPGSAGDFTARVVATGRRRECQWAAAGAAETGSAGSGCGSAVAAVAVPACGPDLTEVMCSAWDAVPVPGR